MQNCDLAMGFLFEWTSANDSDQRITFAPLALLKPNPNPKPSAGPEEHEPACSSPHPRRASSRSTQSRCDRDRIYAAFPCGRHRSPWCPHIVRSWSSAGTLSTECTPCAWRRERTSLSSLSEVHAQPASWRRLLERIFAAAMASLHETKRGRAVVLSSLKEEKLLHSHNNIRRRISSKDEPSDFGSSISS